VKPRTKRIGYGVIAGWMFLPLAPLIVAGLAATANGCTLNEAGAHPCLFFGTDMGGTLYTMGIMGLMTMATVPTGLVALLVFSIFAALHGRTAPVD
jgi:hypothetical protein